MKLLASTSSRRSGADNSANRACPPPTAVPGSARVLVCAGAGHAGKLAGLLGRILTDLAINGTSQFPVSAFRADRPAITGAGPVPVRINSM